MRLLLCGPVYLPLLTLAILSPPPPPPPLHWARSTQRLRLLDLSEIWPLNSLLLPPGTCQPLTPSLGEHLEGEEGQTRRPGWAVVKYWHGNRYHCGAVRLQRDQTPTFLLPPLHILTVEVCCVCPCFCLYFSLFLCLFSISFFNCTHGSRRLWCMHSWSWQSRPGNVWFTDPLLTHWFDLPFTFQSPGILTVQGLLRFDSACLTTVENRSKCAASWLTDWLAEWMCHIIRKAQSNIVGFQPHVQRPHTCSHHLLQRILCH